VGCLPLAGMAELFPSMVTENFIKI